MRVNIVLLFVSHAVLVNSKIGRRKNDTPDVKTQNKPCKLDIDVQKFLTTYRRLLDKYVEVRVKYQKAMEEQNFDREMLRLMVKQRGAAERTIFKAGGDFKLIPAGMNLGGQNIVKIKDKVLFINRMKLRNHTIFRIDDMASDFRNMVLKADLSLNDLHLYGTYNKCDSKHNTSNNEIFFSPKIEEINVFMKNVKYHLEGRYRMLQDRLVLELVASDMELDALIVTIFGPKNIPIVHQDVPDVFSSRIKNNLDKWMKDYFNDYLMYFILTDDKDFQEFDQTKTQLMNYYTDKVIDVLMNKTREIEGDAFKLPDYTIFDITGLRMTLMNGTIRGLDSMYRRSVATASSFQWGNVTLDSVVAFSNLKVSYNYVLYKATKYPPVHGALIYSTDELTAHMALALQQLCQETDSKGAFDYKINIQYLENTKPESLTVEGPANRLLAKMKPMLDNNVIAVMNNAIIYNLQQLGLIADCDVTVIPQLKGFEHFMVNNKLHRTVKENTEQLKLNRVIFNNTVDRTDII